MALNSTTFKIEQEQKQTPTTPAGKWNLESLTQFANSVAQASDVTVTAIDDAKFDDGTKLRFTPCPICKTKSGNADLWIHNGHRCFNCFADHSAGNPTIADLEQLIFPKQLQYLTWNELNTRHAKLPETLIEGLLRRGDTAGFVGSTKSRKTWMVIGLAIDLAIGQDWLDFSINQKRKVLVVDNELQPADLRSRYLMVCKAKKINTNLLEGQITYLSLRGKLLDLKSLSKELEPLGMGKFDVVILDSLYKFFPEKFSENDNAAMTQLLGFVDSIALMLGAAVIFTHHQSKGRQDNKKATDVGSGAGSLSRATDLHMVFRADKDPTKIVVSMAARSQPDRDDFCVRWKFPLFTLSDDQPQLADGQRVQISVEQIVNELHAEPTGYKAFVERIREKFRCTKTQIEARLQTAVEQGLAVKPERKSNEPQKIHRAMSHAQGSEAMEMTLASDDRDGNALSVFATSA